MRAPDRRLGVVDIVVHGRFFAFSLAQAMVEHGQRVRVLTNYPTLIASRFGMTSEMTLPCVWHGISSRLLHRLSVAVNRRVMEPWLHEAFGRWAAKRVNPDADAVICFSGVAEEVFRRLHRDSQALKVLVRASAHIRVQHQLLHEEEERVGIPVEKPSDWMVEREEREYASADLIVVPSTFALDSFRRRGIADRKLALIGLGSDTSRFRPTEQAQNERRRRILSEPRLRVLMVGSLTARKGAFDYGKLAHRLTDLMDFRFVGDVPKDVHAVLNCTPSNMQVFGRVAEHDLPAEYAWADVFVFPTIEDGYAVVIAQALASGLPVICTTNCVGRDVVVEEENGWVVPIRDVDALSRKLQWCNDNRQLLADISLNNATSSKQRDWTHVASDFEQRLFRRK